MLFSKQQRQSSQLEEANLAREISLCCSKPVISDTDKGKLLCKPNWTRFIYIKQKGLILNPEPNGLRKERVTLLTSVD